MLIDYHVHSDTSKDATGRLREHCASAVKKGLSEVCFTNHQEWDSVLDRSYRYAMPIEGWEHLQKELAEERKEFPRLSIRFGCEMGYYPDHLTEMRRFISRFGFDYVIGSVHTVKGRFLEEYDIPAGDDRALLSLHREYYSLVLSMIDSGFFDCVGHLDMIARYQGVVQKEGYADLITKIATSMKKKDVGFELNTKGWSSKNKECHPPPWMIRILKDAGIKKVTLGSDSHNPSTVGEGIEKGMAILREAGFSRFCTFEGRKPIFHNL